MNDRSVHHDEHVVPVRPVESRLEAFHTGLGAVFNRTGGAGGTAAELADSGQV